MSGKGGRIPAGVTAMQRGESSQFGETFGTGIDERHVARFALHEQEVVDAKNLAMAVAIGTTPEFCAGIHVLAGEVSVVEAVDVMIAMDNIAHFGSHERGTPDQCSRFHLLERLR